MVIQKKNRVNEYFFFSKLERERREKAKGKKYLKKAVN